MGLGYWTWEGGSIPLRNYLAWFLISAMLGLLLAMMRPRYGSRLAEPSFGVQLAFFAALRFVIA